MLSRGTLPVRMRTQAAKSRAGSRSLAWFVRAISVGCSSRDGRFPKSVSVLVERFRGDIFLVPIPLAKGLLIRREAKALAGRAVGTVGNSFLVYNSRAWPLRG